MIIASKPLVKRFNLQSDPSGKAWVEIRQPTAKDLADRNDTRIIRRTDANGNIVVEQPFNFFQQQLIDIYYTLADIGGLETVEYGEDSDGNQTEIVKDFHPFKFYEKNGVRRLNHRLEEYMQIMATLVFPQEVIDEIAGYVDEMSGDFLNQTTS